MKNLLSKKVLYVYSGKLRKDAIGIDLVVKKQIDALVNSGCKVFLISRGVYKHNLVFNLSLPITPALLFSFFPARYYYNAQYRFFSFLGSLVLAFFHFDFLVTWSGQGLAMLKVAKKKKIRSFLNCQSSHKKIYTRDDYLWPYIKLSQIQAEYKIADFLLLPSNFSKSTFLSEGFKKNTLVEIGRGVDLSRFFSGLKKSQPIRVVFFGSVTERKGIFQALRAWKLADLKDSEFLVIGNIPKEIFHEVLSFSAPNIRFLGFQKYPEKYLSTSHIQILPTLFEGMAKTLIEGSACGLVTLTTKNSGFPILDGINGFYIDRENIDEYAKKLTLLASDRKLLNFMGKKSEQYVKQYLTWEQFQQKFISGILFNI